MPHRTIRIFVSENKRFHRNILVCLNPTLVGWVTSMSEFKLYKYRIVLSGRKIFGYFYKKVTKKIVFENLYQQKTAMRRNFVILLIYEPWLELSLVVRFFCVLPLIPDQPKSCVPSQMSEHLLTTNDWCGLSLIQPIQLLGCMIQQLQWICQILARIVRR